MQTDKADAAVIAAEVQILKDLKAKAEGGAPAPAASSAAPKKEAPKKEAPKKEAGSAKAEADSELFIYF